MSRRRRFGETLVEAGVVSEAILAKALERQKGSGKRLGQVLEEMGVVTEKDVAVALGRQFGFKTVQNLAKFTYPADLLALLDGDKAIKQGVFPLKIDGRTLYLAMINPLDMEVIDTFSFKTALHVVPCVTTPAEIQAAVRRHYLGQTEVVEDAADGWKILVVDDQALVRATVVAALRKVGYLTVEAENGAEGLRIACQQRPHLVIADTIMPHMDGFEMFRALQAQAATRKLPVLALSSRSTPEEEARLLDAGYFDFIAKPVNPVRLASRVRRALRIAYGDRPPECSETASGPSSQGRLAG